MSYRNYINFDSSLLDSPIYRVMPILRLFDALQGNNLVLVKPQKWDDPFENALLKAPVIDSQGLTASFSAKDSIYGQCWTLHSETDAMWRIYSHDKFGVKIKSTPRKIHDALKAAFPKNWELHCFIGKVKYLNQRDLLTTFDSINLFRTDGSGIAESLLYKRKEFSHEKEVRLIYWTDKCVGEFLKYSIDPNSVIEEIVFDPRTDINFVKAFTILIQKAGFNNKIAQSSLYNPPKGLAIRI